MRACNRIACDNCPSYCGEHGAFKRHNSLKGDKIILSNDKNHMIFIESGSFKISSVDIGEFICSREDTLLLLRNHNYTIDILEDCDILSLSFIQSYQLCDRANIDSIMDFLRGYQYSFHTLKMNSITKDIVHSILRYLKDDVGCLYIHHAKQLELLIAYRFYYSDKQMLEFFYPVVEPRMYFQSLIKANHSKAKSVEELANLCGYNLNSFKKLFKDNMNLSPYQWMLQQNKGKILALLLDHKIPIKAIVSEFGFTSQSHLNRYCNRFLGGTSSQIRGGKNSAKES